MGLFGKKKLDRDEIIAQGIAQAESEAMGGGQEKKEDTFSSGNAKLDMEITKIKAQLESYGEVRKANSERFSRLSEQVGELRGMIMDTNKTLSKIEVSATKAIDLVESVQPEKLMVEIRKQEGKAEALKANIEGNEAMMRDIMEELKKMRQQMNFYKGIEQVAKLNDEVKGEILEIKKVEATIERHADKAETIFIDMEKRFAEFEKFQHTIDDVEKSFHAIQGDFDKMKFQLSNKAEKREFGSLMDKFTEFEKHTGNILQLLDERSKHMKSELKEALKKMKEQLRSRQGARFDAYPQASLPPQAGPMPGVQQMPIGRQASAQSSPTQSQAAASQSAPPQPAGTGAGTRESQAQGPNLSEVLKRRRIISHDLMDEEDSGNGDDKVV